MSRTTRRVYALLAGAVLLTAAACSGGGGEGDDDGGDEAQSADSLTLLTPAAPSSAGGQVLREVIEQFTDETGIEVQVEVAGEDLPTVFETSVAAGQQADIVHINPVDKPLTWIDNEVVVPVGDYLDEWGLTNRLSPGAIEEWTREDGQIQGFPFEGYQWPVWYNTALLDQAGVTEIPETTDDLIAAAEALRAAGIQPFAIGGNDWSGQKLFFQVAQAYLDPDAARELFTNGGWCASPETMQGIELFTQLRDAGVFVDDAEGFEAQSMVAQFISGEAAIMSAGSWEFAQVPPELVDSIQLAGLPVPDGGAYERPTAYQGTSNGFWISQNGADKIDAVRQFIEFMYRPETVTAFVDEAQTTTALVTDAADLGDGQPLLTQVQADLPASVDYAVLPDRWIPGAISQSVIRETAVAFTDGTSADDICAALDTTYGS
ncbi:ABC transporter substrate-binding protein [Jiangella alkaliphila]|uniref:Multiple sugar transport system substrate-binding protein n=1 Tax=Jiangella alkaliphila TaxID=419479 RepID=A0A1H2L382_9ACTN|nr:extracellular solute-binding protein [Jiangella alkaliphila]SDU75450.1 multiple sugar transport system substrate-binding protein [Jiangella alkaliphila]